MPFRRPLALLALVVLLPQVTGCKTYQPMLDIWVPRSPDLAEPGERTRIILANGDEVTLAGVWTDGEVLHGFDVSDRRYRNRPVDIPMNDVVGLEERRVSVLATLIGVGVTYGIIAGLVWAAGGPPESIWRSTQ